MARKLRYFIEYKLVGDKGEREYIPIGVWVHDPFTGEIDFRYGEMYWEEEFDALQPLHRLIDNDLPIPDDFFDYWQAHFPSHKGQRSEIVETEEFGSVGRRLFNSSIQLSSPPLQIRDIFLNPNREP